MWEKTENICPVDHLPNRFPMAFHGSFARLPSLPLGNNQKTILYQPLWIQVPSQTVFRSSWAAECTPFWEADRAGAICPTLAFAALYWAYTGRVKWTNESGHSQFTIHRSSCLLAPERSQYNIPAAPGITSQFSTQVVGKLQWFPCPAAYSKWLILTINAWPVSLNPSYIGI